MRYIKKGDEPEDFIDWKRRNPHANWKDFSGKKASDEARVVYNNLRKKLLSDQEFRCCYCEIFLDNVTKAHIEHVIDRDRSPRDTFEHNNLLASCKCIDTCGQNKSNKYFEEMVTPLQENCQLRLTYTSDGRIIAVNENDENAEKTVNEILKLNDRLLVRRRNEIIRQIEQYEKGMLDQCRENCDSWFGGFPSLIEDFIARN